MNAFFHMCTYVHGHTCNSELFCDGQKPRTYQECGIAGAGLAQYIPQSNNFVVFSAYFQSTGQQPGNGTSWVSFTLQSAYIARSYTSLTLARVLTASTVQAMTLCVPT